MNESSNIKKGENDLNKINNNIGTSSLRIRKNPSLIDESKEFDFMFQTIDKNFRGNLEKMSYYNKQSKNGFNNPQIARIILVEETKKEILNNGILCENITIFCGDDKKDFYGSEKRKTNKKKRKMGLESIIQVRKKIVENKEFQKIEVITPKILGKDNVIRDVINELPEYSLKKFEIDMIGKTNEIYTENLNKEMEEKRKKKEENDNNITNYLEKILLKNKRKNNNNNILNVNKNKTNINAIQPKKDKLEENKLFTKILNEEKMIVCIICKKTFELNDSQMKINSQKITTFNEKKKIDELKYENCLSNFQEIKEKDVFVSNDTPILNSFRNLFNENESYPTDLSSYDSIPEYNFLMNDNDLFINQQKNKQIPFNENSISESEDFTTNSVKDDSSFSYYFDSTRRTVQEDDFFSVDNKPISKNSNTLKNEVECLCSSSSSCSSCFLKSFIIKKNVDNLVGMGKDYCIDNQNSTNSILKIFDGNHFFCEECSINSGRRCIIDNCDKQIEKKNLCSGHLKISKKILKIPPFFKKKIDERFDHLKSIKKLDNNQVQLLMQNSFNYNTQTENRPRCKKKEISKCNKDLYANIFCEQHFDENEERILEKTKEKPIFNEIDTKSSKK